MGRLTNIEIIDKLYQDTDSGKIKWDVKITKNKIAKASYTIKLTEKKCIKFNAIYYSDHPKSTKLYVNFIEKSN